MHADSRLFVDKYVYACIMARGHQLVRTAQPVLGQRALILTTACLPHIIMRIRKRDTQELVARVKEYVADGAHARAGLADIARELAVSPSYLARTFRRNAEVPIHRYALRLRLQRATSLVATSDDLARLALELGFASHSHFSTAFRRWTGYSPTVYRARMREAHVPETPPSLTRPVDVRPL
jgi:AraC-like DNA-binding protein